MILVSPPRSVSVFRLAVGSGTAVAVSGPCPIWSVKAVHQQFDPCLLWPANGGGGIAVREFVAAAVISIIARWGEVYPYRVG